MLIDLIALHFSPIFLQLFVKNTFVDDVRSLIDICDFIGDVYKQNAKPRSRQLYSQLCKKYAHLTKMILKIIIYMYVSVHILFMLGWFVDIWQMRRLVPTLRIYLPVLDQQSHIGMAVLVVFNYYITLVGILSLCAYDCVIFIIFTNIPMVASIMIGHWDELRESLTDENCNLRETRQRLIQIILMDIKYNE